ncbi:MAG: flagellar hook capping FlgD N-terminal domain-containing protein [Pseudorhodobacter sp.]
MDATSASSWYQVQPGTTGNETRKPISSDFDTFLKMLTTQIQNQDPLNPIESSDFAVQLATFSGVEQQTRTNQLLEGLESRFTLLGMAQLAAWVGQEARHSGPVAFDGAPVSVVVDRNPRADRTVLVVANASGTVVGREDLDPAGGEFDWEGISITGAPLPKGTYRFTLEHYRGEEFLGTGVVQSYGRIREAQGGPAGNRLILEGGTVLDASEITALRLAR